MFRHRQAQAAEAASASRTPYLPEKGHRDGRTVTVTSQKSVVLSGTRVRARARIGPRRRRWPWSRAQHEGEPNGEERGGTIDVAAVCQTLSVSRGSVCEMQMQMQHAECGEWERATEV